MKNDEVQNLEPLKGRDNVKEDFDRFLSVFVSVQSEERYVRTPAGSTCLTVFWHRCGDFRVWCGFRDPDVNRRRKYWNCFSIQGAPGEDSQLSPDLETNLPPDGGLNLNYGAVFLSDKNGRDIYLGHTGRITIQHRKKRLTRNQFMARYVSRDPHLPIVTISRAQQGDEVSVVLIGRISGSDFKDGLFGFVKDVRAIKVQFKQEIDRNVGGHNEQIE